MTRKDESKYFYGPPVEFDAEPSVPTPQPVQPANFSLGKEFRELQAQTEKLGKDIQQLQVERHESQLRADAHNPEKLLGLTPLGASVLQERQAKEAAKQAAFEANQVQPMDKYLAMTPLGASILRERKAGGKA